MNHSIVTVEMNDGGDVLLTTIQRRLEDLPVVVKPVYKTGPSDG